MCGIYGPIQINQKIAIKHDKVLEKGKQVHAVLEREVHPEQILVRTDTKADRWGLRCVFIICTTSSCC